eukprot:5608279-Pyramimonas_sp.AAC.1
MKAAWGPLWLSGGAVGGETLCRGGRDGCLGDRFLSSPLSSQRGQVARFSITTGLGGLIDRPEAPP